MLYEVITHLQRGSVDQQSGRDIDSDLFVVFRSARMQGQREAGDRLFNRHRLGGAVNRLQEGKVFVDRFGDLVDGVFIDIGTNAEEVRLGDGVDVLLV